MAINTRKMHASLRKQETALSSLMLKLSLQEPASENRRPIIQDALTYIEWAVINLRKAKALVKR